MIIPKSIKICGKNFKIKLSPLSGGGQFQCDPPQIIIGVKYINRIPEILLHEIVEVIFAIRDMRYYQYSGQENGDLLFSFSHKEFSGAMVDLAAALEGIDFRRK